MLTNLKQHKLLERRAMPESKQFQKNPPNPTPPNHHPTPTQEKGREKRAMEKFFFNTDSRSMARTDIQQVGR